MFKCPYIHKNDTEFGDQNNGESIAACDFCSNIFFRCPKCKQTNRALAIFCRSCGREISFSQAEIDLKLNLSNYEEKNLLILPDNSGKIRNLASYYGYLVIATENKYFISNVNQILKVVDVNGETPLGSSFFKNDTRADLLITTNKKIYSINLLDLNKPADILYEVSDSASILHESLALTDVYWFEREKKSVITKFCSLKKGQIKSYSGGVLPLLKVGENKIFITTESKLELFDGESDSFSAVTLTNETKSDQVNLGCQPVFNEQKMAVYLFGTKSLWRITLDEQNLAAHPLPMNSTGDECLAISKEGHILVSRSDGFYILNSFGTVDWQADSIYILEASNFDGKVPQTSGQYGIFSGITGNGNVLRVYMLNNPNKYSEKVSLGGSSTCAPLFSFGHLFIPIVKSNRQSLKVHKLKELS